MLLMIGLTLAIDKFTEFANVNLDSLYLFFIYFGVMGKEIPSRTLIFCGNYLRTKRMGCFL